MGAPIAYKIAPVDGGYICRVLDSSTYHEVAVRKTLNEACQWLMDQEVARCPTKHRR